MSQETERGSLFTVSKNVFFGFEKTLSLEQKTEKAVAIPRLFPLITGT